MLPNVDSLDSYGGPKRNYSAVIDPTTDEDAKHVNVLKMNVAMMTQTAPRAIRSFVGVDGDDPIDPPSGFVHAAMWGSDPSVKPTVTRLGEGVFEVEYPATVDTELASESEEMGGGAQATIALNFRRARAEVECGGGTLWDARAEVTGSNTITVRTWNAGVLADPVGEIVTIWAY